MKKIKVTLSSLLCFVFSSHVFADGYAPASRIPVSTSGFSLSITGLYLRPDADNLIYATYTRPLPLPAPNWTQVTLKPGFSSAFNVGIQYNFSDPANLASIDWLHVDTNDSDSFNSSGAGSSVAPTYYFGPLAQALTGSFASSNVKFDVDNVNLIVGRLINLGNHIQLSPLAGLQLAYLKQDITSTYNGVGSDSNPYSIVSFNTSKFTGIGPRMGMDATYYFTPSVGVAIKLGGALLMGTMRSDTNFQSFGAGNRTPVYTTLADANQNKVVPEVDSKIEASYIIPMKGEGSGVTFAAGYAWSAYINGINQVFPTALVPGAFNGGAIAIETSAQAQSDLTLNGPYLTVIWKI